MPGGRKAHPGTFSRYSGVSEPARARVRLDQRPALRPAPAPLQHPAPRGVAKPQASLPPFHTQLKAGQSRHCSQVSQCWLQRHRRSGAWCGVCLAHAPGNQLPTFAVTLQPLVAFPRKPVERTGARTARKLLVSMVAAIADCWCGLEVEHVRRGVRRFSLILKWPDLVSRLARFRVLLPAASRTQQEPYGWIVRGGGWSLSLLWCVLVLQHNHRKFFHTQSISLTKTRIHQPYFKLPITLAQHGSYTDSTLLRCPAGNISSSAALAPLQARRRSAPARDALGTAVRPALAR